MKVANVGIVNRHGFFCTSEKVRHKTAENTDRIKTPGKADSQRFNDA